MAGKQKGGQIQIKVDNAQDWDKFVTPAKGLVVIDAYTDWCGPCVAMMSNLKKVKLEQAGENLTLILGRAESVPKLERFKNRSEPTWVFVAGGQLIKVVYGSDSPTVVREVLKEVEHEVAVMEGKRERVTVPWDTLTPEEQNYNNELKEKKYKETELLRKEEELVRDRVKRRNLTRIARKMPNQSVVLYFPQSIKEEEKSATGGVGKRECPAAYSVMVKCEAAGLQIADQLDISLTKEDLEKILYNSTVVLPDEVLDTIHERQCIASVIQRISPITTESRTTHTSKASLDSIGRILNIIEDEVSTLIYGENRDPANPSDNSMAKKFEVELESGIKVTSCWTPVDYISKAAAMQILFPQRVRTLDVIEDPVPPPAYIIIFEASRAHEILEVAEPFASEVIHLAYFTSENHSEAEKICHLIHELEKKGMGVVESAKMVIALERTRSDPLLTLAALNPLYVSPDTHTGTREVELWFPPKVDWEAEPSPWEPPPPDVQYWQDEEENYWIEEERTNSEGEIRLGRRLAKLADGTIVEDGEWKPIPPSEPELPVVKVKEKKKRA